MSMDGESEEFESAVSRRVREIVAEMIPADKREQRRYEIARDVMARELSACTSSDERTLRLCAEFAINAADAFLAALEAK